MFSIQFDPTSKLPAELTSEVPDASSKFMKGYIDFGIESKVQRREEWFIPPLHLWSVQDYQKHWIEALERMVHGHDQSALIVSLGSLMPDDYIGWWPMWRFGEIVKFHEQMLILSELKQPFELDNSYVHVGEYISPEVDEDGHRVSEWEVPVSDMAAFLKAQAKIETGQ